MNSTHLGQEQRSLADMRIIVLLPSLDLEDSGEQALQLTRHMRHTEWADVELWGLRGPGRIARLCEQHSVPWRVVPFSWAGGLLGRIVTLCRFAYTLRRAHPAILVSYTMLPNVLCGLVWRWTGAQLCIWNQQDEGIERLDLTAEKWAVQRTPILVSNSRAGADFLVHSLGAAPKHIRVIHNGVGLARPQYSRLEWRDRLDLKENAFAACTVANLSQNKDHATLLRAWRLVVDRLAIHGQDADLLLAGRPDAAHDFLRALCSHLGLTTNVRFLGMVDDVPGLLQAADLAVFSSFSEGCPNGVLECMAAGLAVVGSDIPGIREALGEEASALLAAPGDASALADRIIALALDRDLRTRIGNLNQMRALAEFAPGRMCQEMVSLMTPLPLPLLIFGYQLADVGRLGWGLSKAFLKRSLTRASRCARRQVRTLLGPHASKRLASLGERALTYWPLTAKLAKEVRPKFKIGMAVLAHERPEYLEMCLESLFSTKLYDYDITFLLHDDGSRDSRVREILDRHRDPEYNIARHYVSAAHGSAGGAINSATRRLFEIDTFNIIGWCDSDTLFHPEWLDQMMKICLWAKKHHKDHVLGPFSCFNSSDFVFHKILNTYSSPYGNYVVKRQMGMLVYFWFTRDLAQIGPFPENRDDETLMTARLARSRIRNFCTETSFAEHIGHVSVLNQWRPSPS